VDLTKSAGPLLPALFCYAMPGCFVLENNMVPDQTSIACELVGRIVIDDRRRLPGRFFGRFTTSATSGFARAA
jgi:hypothetical protein